MIELPRLGWKLLACLNRASTDWIIVVVVSDAGVGTRCVYPQVIEPIGMLPVPSHLGVKLPATPAPPSPR